MRLVTLLRNTLPTLVTVGLIASWAVAESGAAPQPAGGDVTEPRLESRVEPAYPPQARDAGLEADIILQAMIRKDGTVAAQSIDCLRCTVRRKGDEAEEVLHGWCVDFCGAAGEAVSRWRYEPATQDGEPVDVYFAIALSFVID